MKIMFSKLTSLTTLTQLLVGYLAYYLLLTENSIGGSIAHIIHYAHSLPLKQHLLVMGFLPIYIAIVIFGAATLGLLLGKWLEETFIPCIKEKSAKSSFTNEF